jgi:integrase
LLAELLDNLETDYRIQGRRSLSQLHYHLRTVRRVLEGARAVDVDGPRLRSYVQQRLDEGAAHATINRELAAVKRALNLAKQGGLLQSVPYFPHLSEDNARQGFFEAHEVELLLMHLPDHLRDLTRFAYLTGWRKAEILGLTWDMVDMTAGVVRLPTSKNGRGRVFVLVGELLALMQRREADRMVGLRQVDYVFHRYGVPIRSFKKAWKVATRRAGLRGKVFHDLRRTAVRNLVRAGVPERVVMDMTGHRTRSVFDRYNITSPKDLREAAQRLDAYLQTHITPA